MSQPPDLLFFAYLLQYTSQLAVLLCELFDPALEIAHQCLVLCHLRGQKLILKGDFLKQILR
jgi:hypothetical protein